MLSLRKVLACLVAGCIVSIMNTPPADAAFCGGAKYMSSTLSPHQTSWVLVSTTEVVTVYSATFFQWESTQAVPTIAVQRDNLGFTETSLGVYNDTSGSLVVDGYMRWIRAC